MYWFHFIPIWHLKRYAHPHTHKRNGFADFMIARELNLCVVIGSQSNFWWAFFWFMVFFIVWIVHWKTSNVIFIPFGGMCIVFMLTPHFRSVSMFKASDDATTTEKYANNSFIFHHSQLMKAFWQNTLDFPHLEWRTSIDWSECGSHACWYHWVRPYQNVMEVLAAKSRMYTHSTCCIWPP